MKCERCDKKIIENYAKVPHPVTDGIFLIFCQKCAELTGNKSRIDEYFLGPDPKKHPDYDRLKG